MIDRAKAETRDAAIVAAETDAATGGADAAGHGVTREIAVTWSIGAVLAVMLLITVIGGLYVATKLNVASERAGENHELIEQSDANIRKLDQALLPVVRRLYHLEQVVQRHGFEFEMLVLDTDRETGALAAAASGVQEAFAALGDTGGGILSQELLAQIEELVAVMSAMTDELLETEDRNERFDLLLDAQDMQLQSRTTIKTASAQLEEESKRLTALAAENTSKAHHHLEEQYGTLRSVQYGAGWSLGVNLIVVIAAMLLLYRLLDRRLGRVADYANRIAGGDFDARLETTATDKIAQVAAAVGTMGKSLAALVRDGEQKNALAEEAKAKAERENWMNESLRRVSEATQGETRIERLLDQALSILCERLALSGAWVSEFNRGEALLLAACGDIDEATRSALVVEGGAMNNVARDGESRWLELPHGDTAHTLYVAALNESRNEPMVLALVFADSPDEIQKRLVKHTMVNLGVSVRAANQAQTLERNNAELRHKVDEMLAVVNAAAKGDLTREVKVSGADAIGQMSQGLNGFFKELRSHIGTIAVNAQSLTAASEQLSGVGTQIGTNAEQTSDRATAVLAVAEDVTKGVETVAAAAEQMNASIREVADNASSASAVATNGVEIATTTNATVAKLGESSNEIGNVVKVITTIAEQTNLLALNATIEAARAGEAGKGFAVVANEVKDLAKETSQATEDISNKIEAIQVDTRSAVQAIGEIGDIIGKIHEIQQRISSGVENQARTTDEITRVVAGAAQGSTEISQSVASVNQAAQDTLSGATQAQHAAQELSRTAAELQRMVGRFTYEQPREATPSGFGDRVRALSEAPVPQQKVG